MLNLSHGYILPGLTDHEQPPAPPDLGDVALDPAEHDLLQLVVDPAPHGVDHGLGLLEDLLLHKTGEVSLHNLLDLHLEGGDLPGGLPLPVDPVDGEDAHLTGGYVVVLEVDDPVGVLDDGRGVAGEEVLDGIAVGRVDLLSVVSIHPGTKTQFYQKYK